MVREKASDRRDLRRAADLVRSTGGSLTGFVWNEIPARAKSEGASGPSVQIVRSGPGLGNGHASEHLAVSLPAVRQQMRTVGPASYAVPHAL